MAVVGPRPAQPALPQQRSGLGRRGRERESNWWAAALHAPCWGGGCGDGPGFFDHIVMG